MTLRLWMLLETHLCLLEQLVGNSGYQTIKTLNRRSMNQSVGRLARDVTRHR